MVMLLFYTTLFGYKLTPSKPESVPNQSNSNDEVNADSEQTNSEQVESTKKAEEIRKIKQAYHLERRFFQ
ncbi:MAG: radical SAM protein [Microcoleus sp. CSU_2_2]|nr:radical SAM protein [Microcoleus sp. SU_5_3]NJS10071.1 radical SAM protein [Microcoleus sp. CSU_2_2]